MFNKICLTLNLRFFSDEEDSYHLRKKAGIGFNSDLQFYLWMSWMNILHFWEDF